jgi:predicted RNA binding protein YcfA (HicA-like mRNA interferase family)
MSLGPFSGKEVIKVMVGSGIYEWKRTNGDHAILRWESPPGHDADSRTVPVPLHDEIHEGTLKTISEQAGAKDFQAFKQWIAENK